LTYLGTGVVPLAARELRRFVVNPVFLFAVGMCVLIGTGGNDGVVEIDEVVGYPAVFLGGFGMMAMYWLTRSMRDSEPVVGVTPTTRPVRTAALCAVAIVPFLCGWLTLLAFVRVFPIGSPVYGDFSAPAQVAILVGQIVVPSLGGPLLGVALGRWISFPGAAFVAFLLIFGWVELVTVPSLTHPDSAPASSCLPGFPVYADAPAIPSRKARHAAESRVRHSPAASCTRTGSPR